jgi:hypothetical protein
LFVSTHVHFPSTPGLAMRPLILFETRFDFDPVYRM